MMGFKDEPPRIHVKDIMNNKPLCVDKNISVAILAEVMSKKNLEAAVIVENDTPIGIVTEKDLLVKVLAKNKNPENTRAEEIMSTPIITIPPDADIITAMKKMLSHNIRRLIVTEGNEVVGILTVSDLLRITPSLIEIIQERVSINVNKQESIAGYCDICGQWSEFLTLVDGQYVCENCRE